jgi:hypothetical protein
MGIGLDDEAMAEETSSHGGNSGKRRGQIRSAEVRSIVPAELIGRAANSPNDEARAVRVTAFHDSVT